jgi:D-glycero-alpha-D-manno-heptose-7-phosphate kinase
MQKKYIEGLFLEMDHSLLEALGIIENHRMQMAFVVDQARRLVGILTNGDVRRFLLKGGDVNQPVQDCMNTNFHSICAADADSREKLLKLFDLGYSGVPVVDSECRVVDVVTPGFLVPPQENDVLVRARAPARISFAGGGSDLTYYFINNKGSVLSTSIALYAHTTLIPRKDSKICISAQDLDGYEEYASLRELMENPKLGLLSSVVAVIQPSFGFDLFVHSDFPVGSGLGGSSAVTTSVVAAFNELRMDRWGNYQMAELAFHAERLHFGVAGGWQDQYASVFGGFNLIEFGDQKNLVHPIRLDPVAARELEECLILCDTGIEHDSGKLHEKQRAEFHEQKDRGAEFESAVHLSQRMHNHLIRAELNEFGKCLHEAWLVKQRMSSGTSNGRLQQIYAAAIEAGSLGGKLLGAGAGGFFVLFTQPNNRSKVVAQLRQMGCRIRPFRFEGEGVVSWRTRAV